MTHQGVHTTLQAEKELLLLTISHLRPEGLLKTGATHLHPVQVVGGHQATAALLLLQADLLKAGAILHLQGLLKAEVILHLPLVLQAAQEVLLQCPQGHHPDLLQEHLQDQPQEVVVHPHQDRAQEVVLPQDHQEVQADKYDNSRKYLLPAVFWS